MKLNLTKTKALIFDLGGVIINLDIARTIRELAALSSISTDELVNTYWHNPLFHQFEKGEVSDANFRYGLRKLLAVDISDQALDQAWNAMILDIPSERLEMLLNLREKYKVYLLSNTNNIHLEAVLKSCKLTNTLTFEDHFDVAYYSHKMGKRKPDLECYAQVIEENNLNPTHTLFLDDNCDNIAGAKKAGLQTYLVKDPNQLKALLNE